MKIANIQSEAIWSLMKIIPFSLIKRIGSCQLIILYYHVVNNEDVPHISHLYKYKNTRQFCDDLNFLLTHYTPIGLSDVISWRRGKNILPPNCFLLTFDDGFREIYDVIAPILLDKGIPATFFIPSAFLDNRELCYQHKASLLAEKILKKISPGTESEIREILVKMGITFSLISEGVLKVDYRRRKGLDRIAEVLQIDFEKYLNEKQPYLTSDQVKKLINWGFSIGAHSIDHPIYSSISLEDQIHQTIESVIFVRDTFHLEYGVFAFPHNDDHVSREFFFRISNSGIVDLSFGTSGLVEDSAPNNLQRFSLEKPIDSADKIIAFQYAKRIKRLITKGPTILRK